MARDEELFHNNAKPNMKLLLIFHTNYVANIFADKNTVPTTYMHMPAKWLLIKKLDTNTENLCVITFTSNCNGDRQIMSKVWQQNMPVITVSSLSID